MLELRRRKTAHWNLEEEGEHVGTDKKKDRVLEVTRRRSARWNLEEEGYRVVT